MNEEQEWIFSAVSEFVDAINEFGVKRVINELPDDIYVAMMYYFSKEEDVSSS